MTITAQGSVSNAVCTGYRNSAGARYAGGMNGKPPRTVRTAAEWRTLLGLQDPLDAEFLAALNALAGQDVIEGGGLEAARLVADDSDQATLWRLGRET